jgi:molecular chaperone GrpE
VITDDSENDQILLPPADLTEEIEKLREDVRLERDRTLRTLADFTNYRKRIERDAEKLAGEGIRAILIPILDIIDDMEKALQWESDNEQAVAAGVRGIHQKLLVLLTSHGIQRFASTGTPFDPDLHDAVAVIEGSGETAGTIVDELRPGYLWNNELLRVAQVRVAK